jgi:hypothetical protein
MTTIALTTRARLDRLFDEMSGLTRSEAGALIRAALVRNDWRSCTARLRTGLRRARADGEWTPGDSSTMWMVRELVDYHVDVLVGPRSVWKLGRAERRAALATSLIGVSSAVACAHLYPVYVPGAVLDSLSAPWRSVVG